MGLIEELAAEQARSNMKLAVQLCYAHRLHALRRAERMERRAERRLIAPGAAPPTCAARSNSPITDTPAGRCVSASRLSLTRVQ